MLLIALAITTLPATAQTVRIDFGPNDGANGNATTSPDANGRHWNNVVAPQVVPNGLVVSNFRTIENEPTTIGVAIGSNTWRTNGIQNGGLLAPDAALLGEFAIATATQDYFFIEGSTATAVLTLTGLNPGRLYQLRLFGTRNTPEVRRTLYAATGANGTFSTSLQTSGPGIGAGGYDGNNATVATLNGVQPTSAGTIQLRMSVAEGTFAYLGILDVIEGATVPLPTVTDVIERWVTQDGQDPISPGPLLFVGSSSIRRWEPLTRDFSDYRVVQRGFGGSQFPSLNPVVGRIVTPYQPSGIVVWAGTNDLRSGRSAEQVHADFQTFVGLVRAELPTTPIFYLSVTPTPDSASIDTRRRAANNLIAATCQADPTLHFINLAAFFENLQATNLTAFNALYVDGLHLSKSGYAEWRKIVRPAIESVLAPNKSVEPNPDSLQPGERLLFDFGPSDSANGDHTLAPDVNGNRWNNWHGTNGGGLINSGEHVANLIATTGRETGIRIAITGGFLCNGKQNGGLLNPNPALLGDLAVPSATQDYFYCTADDKFGAADDDVPGGFMLDGLDPALSYTFRFFGSRDATETRITEFDVRGATRRIVTLRTSGAGIGAGGANTNNNTVATVSGIRPDTFGQVFVDMTLLQGTFAYLNAMEVVASAPATGIIAWRETWFSAEELANSSLEATLWGAHADPDGDGRTNFEEYTSDTNPRMSDIDPTQWAVEAGIDGDSLTLTYRNNLLSTDVNTTVETSDDLETWTPVDSIVISTSTLYEIRKASVPTDGHPRRFLRLRRETTGTPAAVGISATVESASASKSAAATRPAKRAKIRAKNRSSHRGAASEHRNRRGGHPRAGDRSSR